MATGAEQALPAEMRDTENATFSPDGRRVAIASYLGFAQMWGTRDWNPSPMLHGFLVGVHSVAFSPDSRRLATGSSGQEALKIWDTEGLLVVKYATTAVFCAVATLTVVLTGAVVGDALFGLRPVPLLSGDEVSVPQSFLRALLVAAFVSVSMLGLSAIGLFVSTLTEIPVGAMAATVTLAVASQIVDGIPQLDVLDPYLFSHHWLDVGDLLRTPVAWGSFVDNATVQLAYIAVFGSLAWARLTTKDVLS